MMPQLPDDDDAVLTPGDLAKLFRVDPKTVSRWAQSGRVPCFTTPGGHRRFFVRDVRPLLGPERSP